MCRRFGIWNVTGIWNHSKQMHENYLDSEGTQEVGYDKHGTETANGKTLYKNDKDNNEEVLVC